MSVRLSRIERRERTREELVGAADRLFVAHGFHATSVEQIAAEAGYTKGAVYSNFASKEELFFAVYERRADTAAARVGALVVELGPGAALERLASESGTRRGRDDGWLAVFFEFWSHVVRRPELRARFAQIHARAEEPVVDAAERHAAELGVRLPLTARELTVAMNAMQHGLTLERLTRPDLVDAGLGARAARAVTAAVERQGRSES